MHDYNMPKNITSVAPINYAVYKDAITYNWYNDPLFGGSYSGYSLAIAEELDNIIMHNNTHYKALFAPISDRLFFAGEHATILECIGTMEAAIESGERVAQAIIAQLKNIAL